MERTLVIVKPDGVQRGLSSEVLGRIERRGLKLIGLKMMQIEHDLAQRHYAVHQGKPFYDSLVSYITSGPVVVAAFEGPSAIEAVDKTVGGTNPAQAAAGTIRGDFGVTIDRNLVHRSDSVDNGAQEVALFFGDHELMSYGRDIDRWIFGD
jgi:nucleoside-diphosphate kinase